MTPSNHLRRRFLRRTYTCALSSAILHYETDFLSNETSSFHLKFFVTDMSIERVSKSMRAEFARGDGRIKRKEDDRRKKIQPSETLFVVNFDEDTTKREDLQASCWSPLRCRDHFYRMNSCSRHLSLYFCFVHNE
eukprot:scaffold79475_cov51-Attheya_sp.AAC.2